MVEPRVILRALCPTEAGEIVVLGEDTPFWDELGALLGAPDPAPDGDAAARPASSRTAAARASPELRATSSRAASPCWWRWRTCRAAAPASRPWWRASPTARCRSPPGARSKRSPRSPRASTTWSRSTRRRPAMADPCSAASPRAHLAWGPAEAEFAITACRAELDLRPQLTELYRALRELPPEADRTGPRSRPARSRPLSTQRARLRPPGPRAHRAQPDRARPRRPHLPDPGRGPKRPGALTHLPGEPRRAHGNRARPGARGASCLAAPGVDVEVVDDQVPSPTERTVN